MNILLLGNTLFTPWKHHKKYIIIYTLETLKKGIENK